MFCRGCLPIHKKSFAKYYYRPCQRQGRETCAAASKERHYIINNTEMCTRLICVDYMLTVAVDETPLKASIHSTPKRGPCTYKHGTFWNASSKISLVLLTFNTGMPCEARPSHRFMKEISLPRSHQKQIQPALLASVRAAHNSREKPFVPASPHFLRGCLLPRSGNSNCQMVVTRFCHALHLCLLPATLTCATRHVTDVPGCKSKVRVCLQGIEY